MFWGDKMIKGGHSEMRYHSLHEKLKRLMDAVAVDTDIMILEGFRDEATQHKYFTQGASKVDWPNGKHNTFPSHAVDIAPCPLNWYDKPAFVALSRKVMEKAKELGIPIRWGGDWDGDGDMKDQKFNDLVHYELEG
jgi:peptidoglycan LD-endopeptidase CwlK